jgi:Domain of unknown function (DUF4326)
MFQLTEPTDLEPGPVEQVGRRPLPAHTRSVADEGRWDCPAHRTPDPIARAAAVTEYAIWLAGRADLLSAAGAELAGANLACTCALGSGPCHRDVLLDIANPPTNTFTAAGHAMGLTVRRPWASMLLVPEQLGGKTIDTRSWSTDYRGPVALIAGTRIDERGLAVAQARGLDADWHRDQTGWLGAAVLVDVHAVRRGCCAGCGRVDRTGIGLYHWVFTAPARLSLRSFGRGFLGLRPVSWSVLVRRSPLARHAAVE